MLEGVATLDNTGGTQPFVARGLSVDAAGSASLSKIAGAPGTSGLEDGSGAAARFMQVVALSPDGQGNLYATSGNAIVKIVLP